MSHIKFILYISSIIKERMNITKYIKAAIDGDQESIQYLKSIKKGIYIVVFNPDSNISEKYKNDFTINAGDIVIKPGKFKNNLHYRFCGAKGYNDIWRYSDTEESALCDSAQVFLLTDVSYTVGDYEATVETYMAPTVKRIFDSAELLKGGKEYYRVDDTMKIVDQKINNIKHLVNDEVKEDKKSSFKRITFNL